MPFDSCEYVVRFQLIQPGGGGLLSPFSPFHQWGVGGGGAVPFRPIQSVGGGGCAVPFRPIQSVGMGGGGGGRMYVNFYYKSAIQSQRGGGGGGGRGHDPPPPPAPWLQALPLGVCSAGALQALPMVLM